MNPAFRLYEEATPELIVFLSKTILGTNGAKYQHLDTQQRIKELENPLHLSLIRHDKIIGNITFCRRGKEWYLRYFAFDISFHGKGEKKQNKGKSTLKQDLIQFFHEKIASGEVENFYAFIDPLNTKSAAFAESIGFSVSGLLITQTFSRLHPKRIHQLEFRSFNPEIEQLIKEKFSTERFFFDQNSRGKFYILRDDFNEITAFALVRKIQWKIHQLPGKKGKILTKIVPYIPIINQFIKPENHTFVSVDNVWVKDDASDSLQKLLQGILYQEEEKMIIWWTDSRIQNFKNVKWGITHRILKTNPVHLVQYPKSTDKKDVPFYVVSSDLT